MVVAAAVLYAIMSIMDNIGLVFESISAAVSFVIRLLMPILTGYFIAFLLYRPAAFFGRNFSKIKLFKKRQRGAEILGVFVAFIIFIGLLVAFLYLLIPSIIESVGSITKDIPQYTSAIDDLLLSLSQSESISQVLEFIGVDTANTGSINDLISSFWSEITALLQGLTSFLFSFIVNTGRFLYNFVLGLVFSVYMLIFKNQIKAQIVRVSRIVFKSFYYKLAFVYKVADDMFYKFLVGKGICSIVVGVITLGVCLVLGFKYSPLISLIIAVTNMIPTFGPLIGAVPATLLAMMTAPVYGLYMILIVIVLQVIDGNILGPRVLGNSIGINGFWIIFSIIVMGSLFGVIGMLIAAPLFGVLRILIKSWLYNREHPDEKLTGQMAYAAGMQRYREWSGKKRPKSS